MSRLKCALIVSIFASLCIAPPVVAQQPTKAALWLPCEELIRWVDRGDAQIIVELKNVNRLSETTRRTVLTLSTYAAPESKGFVEAAPAVMYPLADYRNKWIAVSCSEDKDKVFLKVSELMSVDSNGAIVVMGFNALLSIPLDPGTYRITALVSNANGNAEIDDVTQGFVEGRNTDVVLRQPSRFAAIRRALWSLYGLLIAAVLALLLILAGVLKNKIKLVFEKLLDALGKLALGRFAERRFLKRYLENLIYNHKYLNVIGLHTAGISKPLLEDVFVSLRIVPRASYESTTQTADQRATIPFNVAFRSYRHMVLLGGPGAGKTTTLSYALLTFAQNLAKQRLEVDEELLPIYVPLRRLSDSARSIIQDVTDEATKILSAEILNEYPPNYFERRLRQGTCLLLLDGLDEVLDEKTHREIATRINNLLAAYPKNRFVVTCRTAGWKDLLSGEFTVLSAQDFDRDDIQRFVMGWYKAVITQSEYGKLLLEHPEKKRFAEAWAKHRGLIKSVVDSKSRDLIHAINNNNRILAIAVNPMLLSLISLVHLNRQSRRQSLPRGRTALYKECVELLIDFWDRTRDIMSAGPDLTLAQKEAVLREIAFDFQTNYREEDSRENLEQLIKLIVSRLAISIPEKDLLREIETRSGLLTERSIDVLGFTHRTLQEYLVAKHIQLNRNHYDLFSDNFDNQRWREVILLYAGLVDDATELIKGVASSDAPYRRKLAGYCVGDAEGCDSELAQAVIDKLWNEAENDDDPDELVNVMAAIAADYSSEPRSVKEKLSATLIAEITNGIIPTTRQAHAIAAIGRARITHGLPELLWLLNTRSIRLSEAAFNAIVQFGDLALPAIDQFLKRGTGITELSEFIRVLAAINTGAAARMLLTLYDRSTISSPILSERLAKMIANPLVEEDLLGLETAELPAALSNREIDNNGWPFKSAKSGFLVLDAEMRQQVTAVIKAETEPPIVIDSRLSGTSFKVSFPAFLSFLKSFPRVRLDGYRHQTPEFAIFEVLGFDKTDPDKLYYLVEQIKTQFNMPLEFALQKLARADESHLPVAPTREKFWNFLSNACFVLVYLAVLLNGAIVASYILDFDLTRRPVSLLPIIFVTVHFLGLLMCAVLIVVTQRKLKTPIFSRQFLSIIVNPIGGFLKVLPYIGKYRPTIKLVAFQVLVICLSGYLLHVYLLLTNPLPWRPLASPTLIMNLTAPVFFLPLSIYYWKHRVLARNPVLELVSMHPEGRKLIGDIG